MIRYRCDDCSGKKTLESCFESDLNGVIDFCRYKHDNIFLTDDFEMYFKQLTNEKGVISLPDNYFQMSFKEKFDYLKNRYFEKINSEPNFNNQNIM